MVADYTLRSELIAESVRLNAEVRSLRVALDEANTGRQLEIARFDQANRKARRAEAERDRTVAQVQRAKERIDTERANGAISRAVWQRLILILASEGSEQLPAKPDDELEVANQNLRALEKTVTNLKSGLRTEQTARERALALCDEYEGVEGTDYDDLARKIRAALDVHGPAEALRAGYEAMAREAAEDKHGGEE